MQIGILQTGHASEKMRQAVGEYSDYFELLLTGQGLTFRVWNVVDDDFPEEVTDADGWLITGSRHGAYDPLPWIGRLEKFIQAAYATAVPIVGICFGHQIVAQALGGRVEQFSRGWAVGPQDYDWGGQTVRLNAWHQDQVTELPPDADVLATHAFCAYAALAYGSRALTIQAHPEYDDDAIRILIDVRGPEIEAQDRLARAAAGMGRPDSRTEIANRIGAFFREAARG